MIKYAVMTDRFEFNPAKCKDIEKAYINLDDRNNKTVGIYDTIEEARKELANIKVETRQYSYKLAAATVAFIEEGDYWFNDIHEEIQLVSGCSIYDFKGEELPTESEDEE